MFAGVENQLAGQLSMSAIGDYLRRRREDLDYTLGQVFTKSGVAVSSLSLIEDGKRRPQPETLQKLAPALKVDYMTLLAVAGYIPEGATEPDIDLEDPELGIWFYEIPRLDDEQKAFIKKLLRPQMAEFRRDKERGRLGRQPNDEGQG